MIDFNTITEFEKKIAEFFGAPFSVATDSCTHAIELCLRFKKVKYISCPKHTYLSVPMLADKLGIELRWRDEDWQEYYSLSNNIYDAAVLWRRNSYKKEAMMCLSFQHQKHLSTGGRGGMILLSNEKDAIELKKMSYDGRLLHLPWRDQNIELIGYHYAMTPEMAEIGLDKLQNAIETEPRKWTVNDWPDLTKMSVFQK